MQQHLRVSKQVACGRLVMFDLLLNKDTSMAPCAPVS
jgi:hypothetical protein